MPVSFDEEALRRSEVDAEALRKIFDELEFRSLAERILGKNTLTPPTAANGPVQGSLFDLFATEGPSDEKYSTLRDVNSTPHTIFLLTMKKI